MKKDSSKLDYHDLAILGDGSHIAKIQDVIISNACKESDIKLMEEINNDMVRKENKKWD